MWSFAWWWLLLLLPLPWLARRWLSPEPLEMSAALKAPGGHAIARLSTGGRLAKSRWRWPVIALWSVWALCVIAAARPQYVGDPIALPVSGRDLLMAVDLSGSMEEQDFQLEGRWVDRLTATKSVATEFIGNRVGDRLGLILFGREAYLQTPLTFDRRTIEILLDESAIGLAGKETAIGDAIGLAIRTLDDAGVEEGRRVLVLLTDGANTAGEVEPLKAAELAAQRGMIIYTIGIGADALTVRSLFGLRQINPSADLDEATLSAVAEMTGGRYFRARDTDELAEIYSILDELEPADSDEEGYRPVTEYFFWPLAAAALIALAAAAGQLLAAAIRPRLNGGVSASG